MASFYSKTVPTPENIGGGYTGLLKKPGAPGQGLDRAQAAFARELLATSRPARIAYFGQLAQGLRTGISPNIAQTQYQVEGGKREASAQTQQTLADVAARNLGGSTTGITNVAAARGAGNLKVGLTPSDVLMQYVLAAPGAVLGQAQQQVLGPLSGLANIEAQKYLTEVQGQADSYAGIGHAIGQLAGHYVPTTSGATSGVQGVYGT